MARQTIVGLTAVTPLHAGVGGAATDVDQPIQWEPATGWPRLQGSGLRGALRARARDGWTAAEIAAVFGPEDASHGGALRVSDAQLLLLPVRTLGPCPFLWVTAPLALARLARARGVALACPPGPAAFDAAWMQRPPEADAIFLEDWRFRVTGVDLTEVLRLVEPLVAEDLDGLLRARLVVVSDRAFGMLCRHALPVQTRVRLEAETKTVARTGPWDEMLLPPESVLWARLSGGAPRGGPRVTTEEWWEGLRGLVSGAEAWLPLGGHGTIGQGWCRLRWSQAEEAREHADT